MTTTDHDTCRTYAAWLGRTPEEDGMGETTIWEPWVPSLCQRVQVRLSECEWDFPYYEDGSGTLLGRVTGHHEVLNGLVGLVDGVREREYSADGHRFRVRFDQEVRIPEGRCRSAFFAACELIPIDDDARQQRRADGAGE